MATRMLQRRGTAAEWSSANPILSDGEIGEEEDTHQMKIGTGLHWNDTPYSIIAPSIVDAKGDLIVGSANDTVERLARGTTGQHLVVKADGSLEWVKPDFIPNSIFVGSGQMIVADHLGVPKALNQGYPGQFLAAQDEITGDVTWAYPPADVPLSTVTTAGDLIVGSGAGAVARLAKGADGKVLTVVAGILTWVTPSADVPLSTVTAAGDLIVGSGAGAVARLAKGADGKVLTVVAGVLTWVTPSADVPLSTVTAAEDLIVGSGAGTVKRVAKGANGTFLGVSGGILQWIAQLGVIVCTSGTRPAGATAGQVIYETDTFRLYVYEGVGWDLLVSINNPGTFLRGGSGNAGPLVQRGVFTMSMSGGVTASSLITWAGVFANTPSTALTAGLVSGSTPGVIINIGTSSTTQVSYIAKQYTGTFTGSVGGSYVASDA